ncbi:MAG: endonuclease MutS2 [Clostridiales bacterium]|nr:endonuclease MutS2 [Clostridiales bacterium]
MNELYQKSLNILELPTVLTRLANEAVSEGAKERAMKLRPVSNAWEVQSLLTETTDACKLIAFKGTPPFSSIKDVAPSLGRASLGGMLNPRELLDIAALLRCTRLVSAYGGEAEKTSLYGLFGALRANKALEERISTSIVSEEEIADAASSELANIRRHINVANSKVRDILQRMISSSTTQKLLQEPIITQRSDRWVVPVKAEYRGSIPGMVHDVSSSGATLFIEPMQVVQANNEIRELEAKEKQEIERILMELSAAAADCKDDIIYNFGVLTSLDLIFAKGRLAYAMKAVEPEISKDGEVVLRRARHPLLDPKTAVPIDIAIGKGCDTLVITGPNTGGKTVSIKTLGLLCVMAQCGLHIPADSGSCVPIFNEVFADIGDEQSIEQSLSTFSSHMRNLVGILEACGENSLLLLDELNAGTDPAEGAALAISIIEYARRKGAKVATTTHYAELKIYATSTEGVQNASCEFDVETLRPTYRLIMGIPGKSNAFEISRRLGLSDEIINDAKSRIDSDSLDFEDMLAAVQKERQRLEHELEDARLLRIEAEEKVKAAEELRKQAAETRERAGASAKREAETILRDARRLSEEVFNELSEMRKKSAQAENIQQMNDAKAQLRRKLNEAEEKLSGKREEAPPPPSSRPVKAGDVVEILKLGSRAEVISVSPERMLTLQAGIMKITVREDEVRLLDGVKSEKKKYMEKVDDKLRNVPVKAEVDLRGMMTDEAVSVMERYLDSAFMARLNTVTVIHGKGTGAVRAAVHAALKKDRRIKSFRLGRYGEGETGVTIVEFK